jgi:hypothetical protein
VGLLVVRNGHHRRDASLFSIAVQFPKLNVVRLTTDEQGLMINNPPRANPMLQTNGLHEKITRHEFVFGGKIGGKTGANGPE